MKLCVHFDINKTILLIDSSIGRGFEASLSSLLSECSWGTFPLDVPKEDRKEDDWVPISFDAGGSPPCDEAVSYGTYLEDYTCLPKAERRKSKCAFTDNPRFGSSYKPSFENLLDSLKIPSHVDTSHLSFLSTGYYHILPSFFELVNFLVEQEDVDFRLVFRTFGQDTAVIAEEFNIFCENRHPLFKSTRKLDGSDPRFPKDLRLHLPAQSAMFKRTSHQSTGLHLAYNSPHHNLATIATGAENIHRTLMQDLLQLAPAPHSSSHSRNPLYTLAIRDDFQWWDENNESETSGKVLLLEEAQLHVRRPCDVLQVFFDDNIERDRAHIVDVRDCQSFFPLPFAQTQHSCLHRVEPYQAITDRMYYVNAVKALIDKHRNDRKK